MIKLKKYQKILTIFIFFIVSIIISIWIFNKAIFTDTSFDKNEILCELTFGDYDCVDILVPPEFTDGKPLTKKQWEDQFCECHRK